MSQSATRNYSGDGIAAWKVILAGVWMVVTTYVLILFIQVLYAAAVNSVQESRLRTAKSPGASVQAEQLSRLDRTGWIDKENGIVAIPISEAIAIIAAELEQSRLAAEEQQ